MLLLRYLSAVLFLLSPLSGQKNSRSVVETSPELHGVDVSHYQDTIEWDTVAVHQPIDFAFVKATEGHDYVDSLFCQNWESLKRLGIVRGAYHFFRAYGCGEEQAENFLTHVEMHPGDLVPVLDLERTDGMPPEVMREEAAIWLTKVAQALQVTPIIYSNQHFYETYLAGYFDQYPLWIARYSDDMPCLENGKCWDIWQYSNEGCIDGICQKVDLNVFPGSKEALDRLRWYPVEHATTSP